MAALAKGEYANVNGDKVTIPIRSKAKQTRLKSTKIYLPRNSLKTDIPTNRFHTTCVYKLRFRVTLERKGSGRNQLFQGKDHFYAATWTEVHPP